MARKFGFDNAIMADMKAAANDSFADNIKMLALSELHSSAENFYDVTDVDELADDIERQGLKTPIYVIPDNDEDGYKIISGHRRYNAVLKLADSGRYTAKTIPCYIGTSKGEAEDMLDMIMLNATSRVISDADMLTQYRELERIYNEMEADGKKIKGRMREKIAAALQVSPAQVGKIENIIHNAVPEVTEAVEQGGMSISTANEVAKLKPEKQKELIAENAPEKITHKEVKALSKQKTGSMREATESILKQELKNNNNNLIIDPEAEYGDISKQLIMPETQTDDDEFEKEFAEEPFDAEEYNRDFLATPSIEYTECTLTAEETQIIAQSIGMILDSLEQTNPHSYLIMRSLNEKLKKCATYSTNA